MAALLAVSFIVLAVLGRIVIQYTFTGNHGVRVADARTDPIAAIAGTVFVLSFAISLVLIGLDVASIRTLPVWGTAWIPLTGVLLGYTGIVVVLVAQWQMQSSWRIGVDPTETTELITQGLYARSRNPIYFGILLYWTGLCIVAPDPLIVSLGVICWTSIEVIVRCVEEPYLEAVHGQAFSEYRQRTHRYRVI